MKKCWFLGQLRRKLKKLLRFYRKKINNWPMVCFVHNGSEITTWMGYNFNTKTKSTKSQAAFLRKTSFLNFKLQIIRLGQGQWSCTPTHSNSYFYICTYEKTYLAVHFTKACQSTKACQFIVWKVMGLVPKYYLLAEDTREVSISFFLT